MVVMFSRSIVASLLKSTLLNIYYCCFCIFVKVQMKGKVNDSRERTQMFSTARKLMLERNNHGSCSKWLRPQIWTFAAHQGWACKPELPLITPCKGPQSEPRCHKYCASLKRIVSAVSPKTYGKLTAWKRRKPASRWLTGLSLSLHSFASIIIIVIIIIFVYNHRGSEWLTYSLWLITTPQEDACASLCINVQHS